MTQPYFNQRPTKAQIIQQQIEYHTDSNSPGYYEKWFPAKCKSCNRVFNFSASEADSSQTTQCMYCDATLDYSKALARAIYDQLEAQRQVQLQAMMQQPQVFVQQGPSIAQMWLQQSYQRNQPPPPSYRQPGSIWNPINVRVQRH